MSIEILAPEVVDQIAAGEVVERPAHLVKELIENSLDAEATEIAVDFSQGGRWAKVSDNGTGIPVADIPKAFLRFATSKIKTSDDIWKLSSFGFRGEALASIGSVSKVTVFTSTDDSGMGHRMTFSFGKQLSVEPVSRTRGCTILIEDLFQNVPARLKFMKSEASESGQIKTIVKALALANPHVEFRVLYEGKLLFFWPKSTQKERVENILEIKPLYEGTATRGNIKARSYFSDPHQVSRVSKNIWFFAQKRFIQDRSLQAAVMEAYRNLLMHGEFPFVVSFIETDPSEIDVNIHPTKSQVKFLHPQDAFRAVQASIRDTLEKAPWIQSQNDSVNSLSNGIKEFSYKESAIQESIIKEPLLKESIVKEPRPIAYNLQFEDDAFQITHFRTKTENSEKEDLLTVKSEMSNIVVPPSTASKNEILIRHWSLLQVIGQAGLTYIVCQSDKGLILIDQHAAHERIAFERLMNQWRGGKIEIQQFLFPLAIDLNEEKVELLIKRRDEFSKLGIELEVLGPITLGVKSAPALIKDKVLVEEMERISNEMSEWGDSLILEKAITEIAARMACHSVLRAGQSLSHAEMVRMLEEMDEVPMSSFCPHGRPVSVTYSWPELEKDFGRRL